jgi:hypothetical protein
VPERRRLIHEIESSLEKDLKVDQKEPPPVNLSSLIRGGLRVFTEGVKMPLPGNDELATFMDA